MKALKQLRNNIDNIDQEILNLLNKRASFAIAIGQEKRKQSSNHSAIMRHERESQILKSLVQVNQGPIKTPSLQVIFKEIIATCRTLEQPIKVSYLGPKGTYSEIAAKRYFGSDPDIQLQAQLSIESVFESVEKDEVNYGIVPIENSIEGPVNLTKDNFLAVPSVNICGELKIKINHQLLSQEKNLEAIEILWCHEQTLAQCKNWINQYNKNWQIKPVRSNGEAAELAKQTKNSAAIASIQAAQEYSLNILANDVQNSQQNTTRFVILGKQTVEPSGDDKTSLVFTLNHQSGSLFKALENFSQHQVNMTQIISRPTQHTNWQYSFFVDIDGHQNLEPIKTALKHLQKNTVFSRILGSYPKSLEEDH